MQITFSFIKKYALHIAFIQAWTATLGSLYFSEILKYPPCPLCWYQRIFMYPLIFILAVAIWRNDKNAAYYVLPLSITGALIAFYQYLLQMTPLSEVGVATCSSLTPCSAIQIMFFGFITIPFLSLAAFIVITSLMLVILKTKKK